MAKSKQTAIISDEQVISKIYLIRGQKVMLDRDLAALYQVETRVLNRLFREIWIVFQKTLFSNYLNGNLKT